jgi:PIN domain nuclease of toxin-antitoxin system
MVSPAARSHLLDPANEVYLSAVSAWEIEVKHALGKLTLPEPPERYIPAQRQARGIDALPLDEESALHVARLPPLHRDPFDRLLVCQALIGGLTLVTPDAEIARYPVRTLW